MKFTEFKKLVGLTYTELDQICDLPEMYFIRKRYKNLEDFKGWVLVRLAKAFDMTVEQLLSITTENTIKKEVKIKIGE